MPSVAARAIDRDPMHYTFSCMHLLRYAEAKDAFDKAKSPKALEAWRGSSVMRAVKINARDLRNERIAKRAADRKAEREAKREQARARHGS